MEILYRNGEREEVRGHPLALIRKLFTGVLPSLIPDYFKNCHGFFPAKECALERKGFARSSTDQVWDRNSAERPPFMSGGVGYFSYDLGRSMESYFSCRKSCSCRARDDLGLHEFYLAFYDAIAVHDRVRNRLFRLIYPSGDSGRGYQVVESRPGEEEGHPADEAPSQPLRHSWNWGGVGLSSTFSQEEYMEAVRRAKEYIAAGEIYQVNLSQRLAFPLKTSPYKVYRSLRSISPAPFSAFLNTGDGVVLSSSPERFLKRSGLRVETRPIKGTRPRGATPQEDLALSRELLASEKERAEHVMIVDLERNDLGKVCHYGSVQATEREVLESYATVHHIVSTVTGTLRPEVDLASLLQATFPGGSITGAPKIRSMEIIEELEPVRRGIYTGALGYIDFSGAVDLSMVIRTLVIKDGVAYLQVGGGIVADSDPEMEYEETLDKGRGLIQAVTNLSSKTEM